MKKSVLLATSILGATLLANTAVNIVKADDPTPDPVTASTTSNATIEFKKGTDPHPLPPGPDPHPSGGGDLTVDGASDYNFGKDLNLTNKENKFQIVDFTDKTGFTDPDDQASGPQGLVQITDNRGGMPQGWTLTVSGSALGYSGGDDIKGATLNIAKATMKCDTETTEPTDNTPETDAVNGGYSIPLDGSDTPIMHAEAKKGFGTWRQWLGTDMNLDIPANSHAVAEQAYTSTLTWTISELPAG